MPIDLLMNEIKTDIDSDVPGFHRRVIREVHPDLSVSHGKIWSNACSLLEYPWCKF